MKREHVADFTCNSREGGKMGGLKSLRDSETSIHTLVKIWHIK